MTDERPVLFVTNHVPPDRVQAYAALHAREGIELALFGGRSKHATGDVGDPGVPHTRITQRDIAVVAGSGRYRAVVAGTVGRTALPAAWLGARRAGVPFLFWTAFWAHPRTPAHAASFPLLRRLYVAADAVVTYGPHVSAYVRARGARNVHEAPQAVDNDFWGANCDRVAGSREHDRGRVRGRVGSDFTVAFAGRDSREKGLWVLLPAWRTFRPSRTHAALMLAGVGPDAPGARTGGAASTGTVTARGFLPPAELRNFYAQADVLVVPSIATAAFREPWGLVVNEAMNQRTPIIATDAVGAAAGGLVRHERNGLVVPAGDAGTLAAALERLCDDAPLRSRLGDQAARDVHAYTFDAWAGGFSAALSSVAAGAAAPGGLLA